MTDAKIEDLKVRMGWTVSMVVHRGIYSLKDLVLRKRPRQIIGIGEYDSGVTDLGFDKKYLEGLGRKTPKVLTPNA